MSKIVTFQPLLVPKFTLRDAVALIRWKQNSFGPTAWWAPTSIFDLRISFLSVARIFWNRACFSLTNIWQQNQQKTFGYSKGLPDFLENRKSSFLELSRELHTFCLFSYSISAQITSPIYFQKVDLLFEAPQNFVSWVSWVVSWTSTFVSSARFRSA